MIERHVYLRLRPDYRHEREATAEHARQALARIPGVLRATSGVPADEPADKSWDISLTLAFASLDDLEAHRAHPEHGRCMDEYLAPRVQVVKQWNFEVREG